MFLRRTWPLREQVLWQIGETFTISVKFLPYLVNAVVLYLQYNQKYIS